MKNWFTWVILAWLIISSLQLFGIYITTRGMRDDVSKVQQDVKAIREEVSPSVIHNVIPYEAPIRRK
jgi:hypothetical protein